MERKIGKILMDALHLHVVERLLNKWQRDGQTIYGDLGDWARDNYCDTLNSDEREELVKHLIANYVIKHPYCLQKSYIVLQESNVDGEIHITPTPCISRDVARKVLAGIKSDILREHHKFGGYCSSVLAQEFEVEEDEDSFYINDPSDDYYEDIKIIEMNIQTS